MSRWSANTILVLVTWYVRRFPHPCVRQCSSSNVQIIQILYTREIDNDASLFHQSGNHVYPSLDGDRRVPLKPLIRLRSKGNVRCTFHVARGPIHLIAFQPWTEFAFILCAQKRGDCRGELMFVSDENYQVAKHPMQTIKCRPNSNRVWLSPATLTMRATDNAVLPWCRRNAPAYRNSTLRYEGAVL